MKARTVCACIVLALATGCGRLAFDPLDPPIVDASDAAADAAVCTGPFQAPRNLTELNSPNNENGGMLSANGLELYFSSDRPGGAGAYDLYVATRTTASGPFGSPTRIGELSAVGVEDDPFLESNGLTLWFQRGDTLMRATRPDHASAWQVPAPVLELSSGTSDGAPGFTADDLTIYFYSGRAPSVGGSGEPDLWRATRSSAGDPFTNVVHEATASSSSFECCPHVLAGGSQVVFTTRRSGVTEVYVAPRAPDGSLGAATLFSLVDSAATDFDGFTSADGATIGVSSTRSGGVGAADLWVYERSCVSP